MILLRNNLHHLKDSLTSGVNVAYVLETGFLLQGVFPRTTSLSKRHLSPYNFKNNRKNNRNNTLLFQIFSSRKPGETVNFSRIIFKFIISLAFTKASFRLHQYNSKMEQNRNR